MKKKCKYLKIGKKKETIANQKLQVDSRKKQYDKEDKLHEEEGGKKTIIEVLELKYLGFVIA